MDDAPHHRGRRAARTPQRDVNNFWSKFSRKRPSKVTSIFPRLLYASLLPRHPDPRGASSARNAAESYDIAAKECRDKVRRIREECERTNEKFTDPDFDIESDFDSDDNCLFGLRQPRSHHHGSPPPLPPPPDDRSVTTMMTRNAPMEPRSVHRLDWIFRNPQFTVNGYSHTDVQQGVGSDCWWLAAISTIAHRRDLMDRICVARDEECGVYGFVFQRDGEWISTVVDDNLYLACEDFRDRNPEVFDPDGTKAAKFRSLNQRGSEALFFSRCTEENETWLPLLEKAYAKAHGDYEAIDWGFVGDGVEDMTGGVTTSITTNKILRKDRLWKELSGSDGQFVFGLSAQFRSDRVEADSGVALGHAYTILRAVEVDNEDRKGSVRLVKIRYRPLLLTFCEHRRRQSLLTLAGTLGERGISEAGSASGTESGQMDPKSGRRTGWRSLTIGLETTGFFGWSMVTCFKRFDIFTARACSTSTGLSSSNGQAAASLGSLGTCAPNSSLTSRKLVWL